MIDMVIITMMSRFNFSLFAIFYAAGGLTGIIYRAGFSVLTPDCSRMTSDGALPNGHHHFGYCARESAF